MDINFEDTPFTGYNDFTNDELLNIWVYLYSPNSKLQEQIILEKQCETDKGIKIIACKNEKFEEIEILHNEVNIFKDNTLLAKIYSAEQLDSIISMLINNNKYDFKINGNKFNKKVSLGQSKIIKIEIETKKDLEYENFKNYIGRERKDIFQNETRIEEEVIEIEKLRLSPYFNDIVKEPQTDNYFKLIINENRIKLIRKINEFWVSGYLFYVIMGTDGIGKTTTLLYLINFINQYYVLYLNLKLFSNKTKQEAENIFFNEIQRIYFVNKDFMTDFTSKVKYQKFKNLKLSILQEIEKNNINQNMKGIEIMWLLLKTFITKLKGKDKIYNSNLLIILDQYKVDNIDPNYKEINNISFLMNDIAESSLLYRYKLLIIISINNYDTKNMFLENLNISFFDYNNELVPNNNSTKDKIKENKNYEFLNIENFLNEKIEKINNNFNERILKIVNKKISDSACFLNNRYFDQTRKEYINYNSNCKKLIPKDLGKNYLYCIKAFNYSLKYYQLLMELKSKNAIKEKEKEDIYEKRISNLFYSTIFNKIKDNIDKSYNYILNKKSSKELVKLTLECLIKLRNCIYEEMTFLIEDMENLLKIFPVKYLNVFLSCIEELNTSQTNFGFYNFYFNYSNLFIKHAINKIINDYSKNSKYNDYDGINFEKIVNEKILKIPIHNNKLIKRNIFSLVGISKSTKDYVAKLREKENLEFYEFYELKKLQTIKIDGVDENEIKKYTLDVTKNDIFLNQVSKNGRSFDAGLLIKKDTITNSFTNDLILFQDTINKIINCKKREIYIIDAINSKNYLESVYEGLKIDKIYFIFIIPDHYPYINNTKKKLNSYQIYYLYYSLEKDLFLNSQNMVVTDFRIREADISYPEENFSIIKTKSDINLSKYIIKESTKLYLIKKKYTNKTFIDIYNKICEKNCYECIKVSIPLELKENIIKIFISEKYIKDEDIINFIPSSNYKGTEIEDIFKNFNNMIIFSYDKNIYLYYYSYYIIYDNFEIKKIDDLIINNSIDLNDVKSPNKNLDDFKKIKNFPLFYFCFNVIKNYNFADDNFD